MAGVSYADGFYYYSIMINNQVVFHLPQLRDVEDKKVEKCKTVNTPKLQILFWNILENVRRKDTIIDYSVFI